jgi:hypothetical protein
MATQAELRAALAEAVEDSGFPTDEKVAADSWEGEPLAVEEAAPAAADEATLSKEEVPATPAAPEADEVQGELPDEFWGTPLDGIPDEQKRAILERFEQAESTIHQLQAKLAVKPEEPEVAPAPESEEITDEAIALALGYDPDDPYSKPTDRELTLARTLIDLEDKVDGLIRKDEVTTVEAQWNGQLDELESTYGKLPGDRVQVLKYAIDEGIVSPFELYFRLTAPIKKEVDDVVTAARREAAKRAEAGGTKPRATSAGSLPIDASLSLRDATKLAMAEAEKETGFTFKGIFGRKQTD